MTPLTSYMYSKIVNYVYSNNEFVSMDDITSTPDQAFFTKDGQILRAAQSEIKELPID